MEGNYFYLTLITLYPTPRYDSHKMRVEVIGETNASYRVRYLERHANGAPIGTVATVRKKNVKLDPKPKTVDPELIRKPYVDN